MPCMINLQYKSVDFCWSRNVCMNELANFYVYILRLIVLLTELRLVIVILAIVVHLLQLPWLVLQGFWG